MEETKQPFLSHLAELRKRLIISVSVLLLSAVLCFFFAKYIIYFLRMPLPEKFNALKTFAPAEAFFTEIKVAVLSGIFLAAPVIFYQIWKFVAPGLYANEQKIVRPFVLSSIFFFLAGAAFCYTVVLPFVFNFLLNYGATYSDPFLRLKDFLSFTITLLLAFGIVFELPVFIYFLARVGAVKADKLKRFRRFAIVIFFVVGAILTPPDIVSQIMLALPMMLLYEVGILSAVMVEKQRAEAEKKEKEKAEGAGGDAPKEPPS